MRASVTRGIVLGALACTLTLAAQAQERRRPPVGGVASPADAMIFFLARGPADSCGKGCSEWIVAEGAVQWDTHKRLFNFLDRHGDRKRPVVIDTWGESNLNVAVSLGRIIRERGLQTTVGMTYPLICASETEAACFALKRAASSPLNARLHVARSECAISCILVLAGGVRRSLAPETKVMISGTSIRNRLGANVPDTHRDGLTNVYNEELRRYLVDMGVETELVDMVKRAGDLPRRVELPSTEWQRLRLVTDAGP